MVENSFSCSLGWTTWIVSDGSRWAFGLLGIEMNDFIDNQHFSDQIRISILNRNLVNAIPKDNRTGSGN